MRILVVEDEPLVLAVAVDALEEEGFEVVSAHTGAEALKRIEDPFDLLVTDVVLPGPVDGFGVAEAFRERWPAIGVIYLSGFSLHHLPVPGSVFLEKPYRVDDLIKAVRAKAQSHKPPLAD